MISEPAPARRSIIAATIVLALLLGGLESQAAVRNGTVNATVNLRTGPGVDSRVITKIEAGEAVRIEAEQGEWLQVSLESEAFGYRGWVASRFIQLTPTESSSPAVQPLSTAVADPPPLKGTPPATSPAMQTAASAIPPVSLPSPAPLPAAGGFRATATSEPSLATPVTAPPAPPEMDLAPSTPKIQEKPAPVALQNLPAEGKAMPPLVFKEVSSPSAPNRFGDTLQLVLRLATVLLSCLALIVALRAYRLARTALQKAEKTA